MSRSRVSPAVRVVLDPAVVLMALLRSDESARQLRAAWQQGLIRPLLSAETAAQLVRALAYPSLRLSADEQQELLADYLPFAEAVRTEAVRSEAPARGSLQQQAAAHPRLLQLARVGRARWIITGGQDLPEAVTTTGRQPRETREQCTVVAVSSWYRVLTPGQRSQLLC